MLVKKIITGFVIQTFDTDKGRFTAQEFVAGDQVDVEDENGDPADDDMLGEASLLLDMIQPSQGVGHKGKRRKDGRKCEKSTSRSR